MLLWREKSHVKFTSYRAKGVKTFLRQCIFEIDFFALISEKRNVTFKNSKILKMIVIWKYIEFLNIFSGIQEFTVLISPTLSLERESH